MSEINVQGALSDASDDSEDDDNDDRNEFFELVFKGLGSASYYFFRKFKVELKFLETLLWELEYPYYHLRQFQYDNPATQKLVVPNMLLCEGGFLDDLPSIKRGGIITENLPTAQSGAENWKVYDPDSMIKVIRRMYPGKYYKAFLATRCWETGLSEPNGLEVPTKTKFGEGVFPVDYSKLDLHLSKKIGRAHV